MQKFSDVHIVCAAPQSPRKKAKVSETTPPVPTHKISGHQIVLAAGCEWFAGRLESHREPLEVEGEQLSI